MQGNAFMPSYIHQLINMDLENVNLAKKMCLTRWTDANEDLKNVDFYSSTFSSNMYLLKYITAYFMPVYSLQMFLV